MDMYYWVYNWLGKDTIFVVLPLFLAVKLLLNCFSTELLEPKIVGLCVKIAVIP